MAEPPKPPQRTESQYILYSNLICPFAQRAHMTAIEKDVPFTFEKVPLSGEIKKDPSLFKTEHFLKKVNPAGTVPAIEFAGKGGKVINESDVCSFFLEDMFPNSGNSLRPRNAFALASMNLANKLGADVIGPCYGLLKNQDPAADAALVATLEAKLQKWIATFWRGGPKGPFVCGAEFSLADVMIFPFVERFRFTLAHYRGYDMLAGGEAWRGSLNAWLAACSARKSAKETCQKAGFYCAAYAGYAGDRGVSTIKPREAEKA